jgi:hypothetical protein
MERIGFETKRVTCLIYAPALTECVPSCSLGTAYAVQFISDFDTGVQSLSTIQS